jgi:hypothetical protein
LGGQRGSEGVRGAGEEEEEEEEERRETRGKKKAARNGTRSGK